jgi:hypothetical protein
MFSWLKNRQGFQVYLFAAFLLICWLGLGYSFIRIFLGIVEEIPKLGQGTRFFMSMIDVYLEILIKNIIFLWILIHLQGIVGSIVRKNPFDSRNPIRIRKIAWGPLAYALLMIFSDLYWTRGRAASFRELIHHLRTDTGRMILVGVGILIIAKVFEMGIKLQEDQNLTV